MYVFLIGHDHPRMTRRSLDPAVQPLRSSEADNNSADNCRAYPESSYFLFRRLCRIQLKDVLFKCRKSGRLFTVSFGHRVYTNAASFNSAVERRCVSLQNGGATLDYGKLLVKA